MKAVGYLNYGCSNGIPFASIPCHVIHNDGNSFGLAESPLMIRFFKGSKKIRDLPCYPLEFFEGKEALKEKALARGRKFAGMVGHTAHEISGPAMIGGGLTTNVGPPLPCSVSLSLNLSLVLRTRHDRS
jgi:hypothetical protein